MRPSPLTAAIRRITGDDVAEPVDQASAASPIVDACETCGVIDGCVTDPVAREHSAATPPAIPASPSTYSTTDDPSG